MSREQALDELKSYGIEGPYIYLIDIIPLIEMIWADGYAQDSEIHILDNYLVEHVEHVNEIAGYEMLTLNHARAFVSQFLSKKPNTDLMRTLRSLVNPVRLSSSCQESCQMLKDSLLAVCLDIASISVLEYPYEWNERFNAAEKRCFFEILESLEK